MPASQSRYAGRNRILSRLSAADFGLVEPHLEAVELPLRKQLETPNTLIEHIYFIENGIASVVGNDGGGRSIEVGIIGREGMTGLAVVMGTDRSPNETFIQLEGDGYCMPATGCRDVMQQSATLQRSFLQFGHAFVVQTAHTAVANGRSKIEERLARWLLMAHDRVDGDELCLTHEFLATMLAVRRPGVTVALNLLETAGLIRRHRGAISIADRAGLEARSKGAYGVPEAEFQRLFG